MDHDLKGGTVKRSALKRSTKPMKRGGRLKSKAKGRSPLAAAYALEHPKCELCFWLDGDHWTDFRSRDKRPCGAIQVHHVFIPSRWEDGFANFLSCCECSHDYAKPKAQYVRLCCTAAKIANGTLDRDAVRENWRDNVDPIQAIDADIQAGLMGVPESVWEIPWTYVKDSFG
jgi:hypothetical protein